MLKIKSAFLKWRRNDQGTFAVYSALAFPVLLAIAGFGLDYWSTLSVKARLDAAVDTAAIAAAKAANAYVQANGATQTGSQLTDAAKTAGRTAANQAFYANAGPSEIYTPVAPVIDVSYQNAAFTATVSYSTTRPTIFAGLLGVPNLGLGGTSTATQHQLTYINVYVLVDTSQSMGIASNQTQMAAMYNASAPYNADGQGVGCVFGCHVASGTSVSMETVAHDNNIQLRIDVARAAIYNMAQKAKASAVNNNISFGIYSMQQPPGSSTVISQVYPSSGVTADYTALTAAMAPNSYLLDLGPNNSGGVGDSNQATSLSRFAQSLPSQGDGSSASSPLNYVYVITDGAIDVQGSCTYGHCMQAIPSSSCDAIKQKGATVGVVYTTYINIYSKNKPSLGLDFRFRDLVAPIVGLFPGNLSSCASGSGWYYQADDDAALLAAVENLFASTLSLVRLTN